VAEINIIVLLRSFTMGILCCMRRKDWPDDKVVDKMALAECIPLPHYIEISAVMLAAVI